MLFVIFIGYCICCAAASGSVPHTMKKLNLSISEIRLATAHLSSQAFSELLWHKNKPFTIYTLQCPDPALLTLSSQHLLLSESASYQPVRPESLWHPGRVLGRDPPPKLSKNCWSHPATVLFPVTVEIVCFSFPGWLWELVCVWVRLFLWKSLLNPNLAGGEGVKVR